MNDSPGFGLTVLGSGGPFVNPTRASSGYVVWVDRKPAILLDAGGGAFERLGRAGIDPAAIDLMLYSHTHIDHTGGLAPIVFAAAMAERGRPFDLIGPQGRDMHPGAMRFAELLFGENGAWSYLHTFDGFGCNAHEVPSDPATPQATEIAVRSGVTVSRIASVPVRHGMMPSVAYRIERDGRAICYSGDVAEDSDALLRSRAIATCSSTTRRFPSATCRTGRFTPNRRKSAGSRRRHAARRSSSRTSCPNSKTKSTTHCA